MGVTRYWILFNLAFVFAASFAKAQDINKPYSAIGLGVLDYPAFIQSQSMGTLGIGTHVDNSYSILNPSLSIYDSIFSSFESGFIGEFKNISSDTAAAQGVGANPRYFALGFPIKRGKWSAGFGLKPYSTVNYSLQNVEFTGESTSVIQRRGSGGITEMFLTQGVRIAHFNIKTKKDTLKHTVAAGAKVSFLFGGIEDDNIASVSLNGVPSRYQISLANNLRFSGLKYQGSISYRAELPGKKSSIPSYLLIGATYDLGGNVGTISDQIFEKRVGGQSRPDYTGDTTERANVVDGVSGNVFIPAAFGIGASYQKPGKLNVGVDLFMQDWSRFRDVNDLADSSLSASFRLAGGVSFVPDLFSVNNYFKRVTYRFGTFFENTPYVIDQTEINNFGLTFGVSLPMRDRISTINPAFTLGFMGNDANGLVREQYFQIQFGITFNDVWFKKYRYD